MHIKYWKLKAIQQLLTKSIAKLFESTKQHIQRKIDVNDHNTWDHSQSTLARQYPINRETRGVHWMSPPAINIKQQWKNIGEHLYGVCWQFTLGIFNWTAYLKAYSVQVKFPHFQLLFCHFHMTASKIVITIGICILFQSNKRKMFCGTTCEMWYVYPEMYMYFTWQRKKR